MMASQYQTETQREVVTTVPAAGYAHAGGAYDPQGKTYDSVMAPHAHGALPLGYEAHNASLAAAAHSPSVNIMLRPIAAPSAFGYVAFFAATWVLNTWWADWYGSAGSSGILWPFVMILGGVSQFLAGLWCYPARDILGSVFHCSWGAFYLSWGILQHQFSAGLATPFAKFADNEELAMMFVVMSFITLMCGLAALGRNLISAGLMFLMWIGTVLQFAGFFTGTTGCIKAGAYFCIVASVVALYRSFAFLVEENFIGKFLPVLKTHQDNEKPLIRIPIGEPGIKKGQ